MTFIVTHCTEYKSSHFLFYFLRNQENTQSTATFYLKVWLWGMLIRFSVSSRLLTEKRTIATREAGLYRWTGQTHKNTSHPDATARHSRGCLHLFPESDMLLPVQKGLRPMRNANDKSVRCGCEFHLKEKQEN